MEKCFFDVLVFIYQHYQLSIYVKCSRYSGCLLQQPCCICCCIRIDHYSSAGMERLFGYWSQLAKTQKQLMLLLCNALCKYDARCWSLTFTMCLQINVPNLAVQNIQRSLRRKKKNKKNYIVKTSMDYKTGRSILHFSLHNTTPDTIAPRTVKSCETQAQVSRRERKLQVFTHSI